jgi:cyanophycin synthetase
MAYVENSDIIRINARKTDAFDLFNFRYYTGANPYLNTRSLVFDFVLTYNSEPLPIEDYVSIISDRYPHLSEETYHSYAHLFARTAAEMGKLDMGLHLDRWSIKDYPDFARIGVQSLHERTTREVVFFVWDWFEAIAQQEDIPFDEKMRSLQNRFRHSVYGGPTVYALLRTADAKGIPTFYLWDEGLMQYGYGKKHVRGVATTFNCDSHLDSDFTTRKDDCKAFLGTLGFPVPKGDIVLSSAEALSIAKEIGYPIAIKPVVGHKGIGVTADIQNADELELAFDRAVQAIPENERIRVIVEKSISGSDFRLLCVNGRFVAATERRPASVVGDGYLTIDELIDFHIGNFCQNTDYYFQPNIGSSLTRNYRSRSRTPSRLDNWGSLSRCCFRQSLRKNLEQDSTVIVKEENKISIHRKGLLEQYTLEEDEPFTRVYLKEIGTVV